MEDLVRLLIKKNVTISSVESFTVGNFAKQLLDQFQEFLLFIREVLSVIRQLLSIRY